jgi:cardiolipin synthase
MRYKLYKTSHTAWDAMIEAIDSAQKSIYMEMYIFLDDTAESHDFIGKLIKKAELGVQVIVVADAFGSSDLKKETLSHLKSAGVEVLFFSHWLRHIHRKILIIDKKIAFMGGVNIGKRFFNWHDLQLKLSGLIVQRLLKSFAYTYEMSGGKDKKMLILRKKKLSYTLKYWLIEHLPGKNIYTLKNHYIEKITSATNTIQIATPYFTPPRWLISLLDSAVLRGVKVELIVPLHADLPLMDHINYRYMQDVKKIGVDFFLTKTMIHAKLLLIDGREGLIGSQNLDLASFNYNSEVGLFFTDKKLIADLATVITEWKSDSVPLAEKKFKMHTIDYLIFALSKILRPIL